MTMSSLPCWVLTLRHMRYMARVSTGRKQHRQSSVAAQWPRRIIDVWQAAWTGVAARWPQRQGDGRTARDAMASGSRGQRAYVTAGEGMRACVVDVIAEWGL